MKRWYWVALALMIAALGTGVIYYGVTKYQERKREAAYQRALLLYSNDIKPGLSRKQVESYLHGKNAAYRHMCCVGKHQAAWADLVRIGQEGAPWFCEENNVYVAFEFAAVEQHDFWEARDSDRLEQVSIFHWLEGCL
jgi:hypothetical protein